jgi:hypothetical protein
MKFSIDKLEFGTLNLTEQTGQTTPDGCYVFQPTARVTATRHGVTLKFEIAPETAAAIEDLLQAEIEAWARVYLT